MILCLFLIHANFNISNKTIVLSFKETLNIDIITVIAGDNSFNLLQNKTKSTRHSFICDVICQRASHFIHILVKIPNDIILSNFNMISYNTVAIGDDIKI